MTGWQGGSTRKWRTIRLAVLRRDRYRCQVRIAGICKTVADCVHHLDGKAHGDRQDRLVASCTPCNLHVGDPTASTSTTQSDPEPRSTTTW
jgi:5-methylcytosine-specific restriction endonuclease McrA